MRARPFIQAGESPRVYSELKAEQRAGDLRERTLSEIAHLEGEAAATTDPLERRELQGRAEDLRCALSGR